MKGIVADFVIGSHVENGLAGCLNGFAMNFAVSRSWRPAGVGLVLGAKMRFEFLSYRFDYR